MKHITSSNVQWTEKKGYSKKVMLTPDILKQPGLLVQSLRIKPNETCAPHFHKIQTEIFYFINTSGVFEVNGVKIPLSTNDVLVVEPNDIHATWNDSDEEFLYVAFKFDWVDGDYYEVASKS